MYFQTYINYNLYKLTFATTPYDVEATTLTAPTPSPIVPPTAPLVKLTAPLPILHKNPAGAAGCGVAGASSA